MDMPASRSARAGRALNRPTAPCASANMPHIEGMTKEYEFIIRPERLSRTTASQVRACWLAMPGATSLPAPVPRPIVHPCPTAPHVGTGGHGY